jgi:eukaryotic-like serine/threonine-protein kinase
VSSTVLPRYALVPPDRLLYLQQGALVERHFDPDRASLTGEPVTLAAAVGAFSVSASGIVAQREHRENRTELSFFARDGNRLQAVSNQFVNVPELSPDDRRLAFDGIGTDGNRDLWLIDLARGVRTRLTDGTAIDGYPVWSPDGSRIAFHSNRNGTIDLWVKAASGAGPEELLLQQPENEWPLDWSSDGRWLLYQRSDLQASWDLWALPMTGADRTPIAVATSRFTERMGEFSPDGRWLVYDTNESGRSEIVVQAFPAAGEKLQVSSGGGMSPRWSADGGEIYFLSPDSRMMAVTVSAKGSTLELGAPAVLFSRRVVVSPFKWEYTVSRDGRFLAEETVLEPNAPPITLILKSKL